MRHEVSFQLYKEIIKAQLEYFILFGLYTSGNNVSQLDKAQKRVAKVMEDVENIACG